MVCTRVGKTHSPAVDREDFPPRIGRSRRVLPHPIADRPLPFGMSVLRTSVFLIMMTGVGAPLARADERPAVSEAEVASYRTHLEILADPAMDGRGPGLPGNRTAAEYLEHHFRRLGLQPLFPSGTRPGSATPESPSYYQRFTAGRDVKVAGATLAFTPATLPAGADPAIERQTLLLNDDYVVLGNSGAASVEGEIAFVGYSIEASEGDRGTPGVAAADASYIASDDLTGKIALMFRFEPLNEQGKSRLSDKGQWTPASAIAQKIMAAVNRKAAGIILVSPPGVDDKRAFKLETTESSAAWTRQLSIPAVMVTGPAAERLVRAASTDPSLRTLLDLRKWADRGVAAAAEGQSAVINMPGAKVKIETDVSRVDRVTWNVGAVLPGRGDLKDQYIVIGAHFDHVGYGYQGGSRSNEYGVVHPGADDNASGTSGLLLTAEKFAAEYGAGAMSGMDAGGAARRSIVFLGFSAEEMGLIGAREFVKATPIEAKSITAMLNMDMIGRLRPKFDPAANRDRDHLMIAGTGTAEGFMDLLKPIFDASGLYVDPSPGGRGPSDHAVFFGAGVPVLHFYTGLHEEYHTPRDTVDLINVPGAVQVANMVYDIADTLATRPQALVFTSTDKGAAALRADGPGDGPAGPRMSGIKVRFGIAPGNYSEEGDGVTVSEVFDNTSASEAGIKAGDRLVRWNGEPIGDVSNWMTFLTKHKPGDVVDVTLMRRTDDKDPKSPSEEVTVRVTLKARDQAAR
jgi:hypothetical protein